MRDVALEAPVPLQRTFGAASLAVRCRNGTTALADLREEGAAKLRFPRRAGSTAGKEVVLVNTAGGLTDGDRLAWSARVGPDATLTLTTQACERIYRAAASNSPARVSTHLAVEGTALWLPQETILFDRSALDRHLAVDLAPGARLLACEAILFGRLAMDERDVRTALRDRWDVRRDATLVHAERFRFEGRSAALLDRAAIGGGARASATVLLAASDGEALVDAARSIVASNGAAAWCPDTERLVVRLLATEGRALRATLVPLLERFAGALEASLPKVWSL